MRHHSMELDDRPAPPSNASADLIRTQILDLAKTFKTAWVGLGQALYPVWKDKFFYGWGHEKFEDYVQRELGIGKPTALKLVKSYAFIEQQEPAYLKQEFIESRDPAHVPGQDEVNVLRLARGKKELTRDDYQTLRAAVFEKGKDAGLVRKDLVAIMKQRKQVDPDEERELRNTVAMRKFLNAVRSFTKDMTALNLAPADLIEEVQKLKDRLEREVD